MDEITRKIQHGFRLGSEEQHELLCLPNFEELFALYMTKGRYPVLDDDVVCLMFEKPNREVLLGLYLKRCPLNLRQQLELFNLNDDFKLLKFYITKAPLDVKLQEKLFTLPKRIELLKLYVLRHSLSYGLHWKLFKLDDDYEVLKTVLERGRLCLGLENRFFRIPQGKRAELLGLYLRRHSERMDIKKKIQELPVQEQEAVFAIAQGV